MFYHALRFVPQHSAVPNERLFFYHYLMRRTSLTDLVAKKNFDQVDQQLSKSLVLVGEAHLALSQGIRTINERVLSLFVDQAMEDSEQEGFKGWVSDKLWIIGAGVEVLNEYLAEKGEHLGRFAIRLSKVLPEVSTDVQSHINQFAQQLKDRLDDTQP